MLEYVIEEGGFMKKIPRRAGVILFALVMIIFISVGVLFVNMNQEDTTENIRYNVVKENQPLMATYVGSISIEQSSDEYKEYQINIKKGIKVGDYAISEDQTFSKYIQAKGPNREETLTDSSERIVTHYAYALLLSGDILETTENNQKTYRIVNAQITYNCIPVVSTNNGQTLEIANLGKTKTKKVSLNDFTSALKSLDNRNEILAW